MLIADPKSGQSGFSLIELMIAIAISVIILGFAIPSFRVMLLNSEIRNAAESIQSGLQQARALAIKYRTTNVQFVLQAKAARDETSWVIQTQGAGGLPPTVLDRMSSREGSVDVLRTEAPVGATTVTFDLTGRPVANADGTATLTSIGLTVPTSVLKAADAKNLNVTIPFTGMVRMCDPNKTLPDPRAC